MNGTNLPPMKRLYLDVCCLQRPFDDQSQARVRDESTAVLTVLAYCAAGGADLLSSDALEDEAGRNPHPDRRLYTDQVFVLAADTVRKTGPVEARAAALEAAGLKPLAALHLACATAGRADYFCTCDDRLVRRGRVAQQPPPAIVSPTELVTELGL